jgi:hypothetical protein
LPRTLTKIAIVKVIHFSHIITKHIILKLVYINGKGGANMTQIQNKMHQMKLEIAAEFGIENYDSIDKGELPSRVNGKIGGEMTKRLIELGKMQLAQMTQRELVPVVVERESILKKQLMLPWPEQYDGDFLPDPFHHNPLKNDFYN